MTRKELIRKICWVAGALASSTIIYLGTILFLHPSSVGSPSFGRFINIWAGIWTLNFLIVFVLAFILARDLIKLLFEYQAQRPGSRIKGKLVAAHIVISLFPAVIMSILALGLINETLDQWFRSPARQLRQSVQQIEFNYYAMHRRLALERLAGIAGRIGGVSRASRLRSESLRQDDEAGLKGLLVVDAEGRAVVKTGEWDPLEALPEHPEIGPGLERLLGGEVFYTRRKSTGEDSELGGSATYDLGYVGAPLRRGDRVEGAVLARFILPNSAEFYRIGVEEALNAQGAIRGDESALRVAYFSIIGISTLAVVLGFVWLGAYIARKITAPIEALAQGARELREGNLAHRVEVDAVDELGELVKSFNQMAGDIRQSRSHLETANAELRASNIQLDERRRYIETIVHNISTGVVSIDRDEVVQSVNEAAAKMFQIRKEKVCKRPVRELADDYFYQEFLKLKKRAHVYGTYRKELTFKRGHRKMHIAATMTLSRSAAGHEFEYLIVLDDLTELIQAEKFAAWQEVAQRLAHEIKNPLTPIQLSAERVKKRFQRIAARSDLKAQELEAFGKVLYEATEIIVSEAEMLKTLVKEFSRFARLPAHSPQPVALHDLIDRTLTLYDGDLSKVRISKSYDDRLSQINADPEQMQRVFINLINNSLDALAELNGDRRIDIQTRIDAPRGIVRVSFRDNGGGIEPDDYENLFLPYFSTKNRGTGLGLAIVRQIVAEHKGSIRAEPNHPRGTSLILDLPLQ